MFWSQLNSPNSSQQLLRKVCQEKLAEIGKQTETTADSVAFEKYRDDPISFFREQLRIEPWSRQCDILHAVGTHRRVAVRSGHKVSKTNSAAGIALWWYATRPRAKVIITSSAYGQIETILWPELTKLYRNSATPLGGTLLRTPHGGLKAPDGRMVFGQSTDTTERAAGQSGDELLYLADEASGIEDDIFEAFFGNLSGGGAIFLFGNPTQTSGLFHRAFYEESELWEGLHISSEESPNYIAKKVVIPGLCEYEAVEERRKAWGEHSSQFQVRVKGNFPEQGDNTIIGLAALEASEKRWEDTDGQGVLELGVDCAGYGDDENVIAPRRGNKLFELEGHHSVDSITLAGFVMAVVRKHRSQYEPKARIKIDCCGGYGTALAERLQERQFRDEVEVFEINVAETADNEDDFSNLRSQLWFAVADWLASGGSIPKDKKLQAELKSAKYKFDSRGRRLVEPKAEIKKRIKRSPDRADATALAIYTPPRPRDDTQGYAGNVETYQSPMGF